MSGKEYNEGLEWAANRLEEFADSTFDIHAFAKNMADSIRSQKRPIRVNGGREQNTIDCLSSEVSALRKVLKECRKEWDTADNGVCAVCRCGHRLFDLKGNVQKCENPECLSHRIREALEHGDPCDICGTEMTGESRTTKVEQAIFGAHKNCMEQDKSHESV